MEDLHRRDVIWRVYSSVIAMLDYRKLTLVSGDALNFAGGKNNPEDIVPAIQLKGFIIIAAKDGGIERHLTTDLEIRTIFVIVHAKSDNLRSTEDFEKMMRQIPDINSTNRSYNYDIYVITENPVTSAIGNAIARHTILDPEAGGFTRTTNYDYSYFLFNKMLHISMPINVAILTRAEEKKVLTFQRLEKKNLSKMYRNDNVAVWLGAEVGDIVAADELCETGLRRVYRTVRPAPV